MVVNTKILKTYVAVNRSTSRFHGSQVNKKTNNQFENEELQHYYALNAMFIV